MRSTLLSSRSVGLIPIASSIRPRRWLVRIFLGRDRETHRRRYLSRTVHGPVRQAQSYLNKVLRERDLGRRIEGVTITLNEFLDRWLEAAAKLKLRDKSYENYRACYGATPTCARRTNTIRNHPTRRASGRRSAQGRCE